MYSVILFLLFLFHLGMFVAQGMCVAQEMCVAQGMCVAQEMCVANRDVCSSKGCVAQC